MAKKQDRVTFREFRKAFNKALPVFTDPNLPAFPERDALKKKLEAIFPSKSPSSSVTVKQFNEKAYKAISPGKNRFKTRLDVGEVSLAEYHMLSWVINKMPTLQKALAAERKKTEAVHQRELARKRSVPAKRRETVSQRLDRLERDNASLREQLNNRPPSAEEDRKLREWYEKNDTRIGGYKDPGTRIGLRD